MLGAADGVAWCLGCGLRGSISGWFAVLYSNDATVVEVGFKIAGLNSTIVYSDSRRTSLSYAHQLNQADAGPVDHSPSRDPLVAWCVRPARGGVWGLLSSN